MKPPFLLAFAKTGFRRRWGRTIQWWCCLGLLLPGLSQAASVSFFHAPFVNPRVVSEFMTWISDNQDQVVAINLDGSQDSNRYFLAAAPGKRKAGEAAWQTVNTPSGDASPMVCAHHYEATGVRDEVAELVDCYQAIGQNRDGLVVLLMKQRDDSGSGVFSSVLFLQSRQDQDINGQQRHVLYKRGAVPLGDRVTIQKLSLDGNRLTIAIEGEPLRVIDVSR